MNSEALLQILIQVSECWWGAIYWAHAEGDTSFRVAADDPLPLLIKEEFDIL